MPMSAISNLRRVARSTIQVVLLQCQPIAIKLDDTNHLLWKQQVLATIGAYGLDGYLTGDFPPPKEFTSGTSDDRTIIYPDFITWNRQDKLITSWLLASMTNSVLISIVGLTSLKEIWTTLKANYASQSRARLMQLKYQLQMLKKGNMSMSEYLNKVKMCCDILGVTGERISDENHVLHILAGLWAEYNPIMIYITSRVELYSLRKAKDLLLSYESRLQLFEQPNLNSDGSSPTTQHKHSKVEMETHRIAMAAEVEMVETVRGEQGKGKV
ncbi:hypothetical protein C2S52_018362 [Perilla frutescens var. hirtella]|nr:hypothetical protein C2S52_018362 [Perilla frutescens var. hirtella]KAH6812076.1 hypothetical protein C2S51_025838 [Perilla frutescens var. frutescens]